MTRPCGRWLLSESDVEARRTAIEKLYHRVCWRNAHRRSRRRVTQPLDLPGHALQRAAAENA